LPLRAALLKGQYFEPLDIMQFYLTSFVVLLLQAIGAPALAQDLADKAVTQAAHTQSAPAWLQSPPRIVPQADFAHAARQWSLRVMRRAERLYANPIDGPLVNGHEGRSLVTFQTSLAGRAETCAIHRSSGIDVLDAVACQAVMDTPGLPIMRGEDGTAKPQWLILPVVFVDGDKHELEEGAP
jgi:TonB family protein